MKTKQQKTKKLRYLSASYTSDPNLFLKEVVYQWNSNWSTIFSFLFSYSMCPQLDRNRVFDYGFSYLHLAQMIEAAHCILKMRNWQPTAKDELFSYKNFFEICDISDNDKVDAQRIITDFFGFMKLRDWYEFLDELLLSSDIMNKQSQGIDILQEHLIAREFIVLLPKALLQLHIDNKELALHNPTSHV